MQFTLLVMEPLRRGMFLCLPFTRRVVMTSLSLSFVLSSLRKLIKSMFWKRGVRVLFLESVLQGEERIRSSISRLVSSQDVIANPGKYFSSAEVGLDQLNLGEKLADPLFHRCSSSSKGSESNKKDGPALFLFTHLLLLKHVEELRRLYEASYQQCAEWYQSLGTIHSEDAWSYIQVTPSSSSPLLSLP